MLGPTRQAGIDMVDAPCPMGCPRNDIVILNARDRITKREGVFQVVRCVKCGLVRTNPRPDAASIGEFYPDDYPPYQLGNLPADAPEAARPSAATSWFTRLLQRGKTRSRRLPPIAPGRMLEIGCASGDFLAEAAAQGWQVEGLEFSATAAERAQRRGFHVLAGSLESADLPRNHYDLAVGWMVLEHLHDPVAALRILHDAVRPDGWIALSVPNFRCIGQRIFGENWHALQVPAHMSHFTPRTARAVLAAGGWEVTWLGHQRNLSSWMISLAWWLQDRDLAEGLSRRLEDYPNWSFAHRMPLYPLAFLVGVIGQSGRMNILARRMDTLL